MTTQFDELEEIISNQLEGVNSMSTQMAPSEQFGVNVFNRAVMQKMLPLEIYQNVVQAMDGKGKICEEYSDTIAVAMKEWAMSLGATHFTHWFQPLTGASAEKHDAFIEWSSADKMIEKFTGKQLIQGEPDASSFPSGGLRSTFEARGYTGWDPTSPVFVWRAADGVTLMIPSVFFSWTGDVLDCKIPLHRSEKKLETEVLRLLQLTGISAEKVYTTIGLEQEYFVIDRSLRDLRPDLKLSGRTVFGAPSSKGQELQDHYFGAVKERVLSFMHDFECSALRLGIPVKTRHNEVAPGQHEVAPVAEKATLAIDHNLQLMELMRKIGERHELAVLLHEKPFADLNGSGKHCNWSVATDTGINLLDPTDSPENTLHFLVLMTAIISGVHKHSALLRSSIGSVSNDHRLGGHEAPPAIISVFLGQELESLLDSIEKHGFHKGRGEKNKYNLGIRELPSLTQDYTDRNRTSPFAFTGNKFEYRALGSLANPSMAVTVLNAIVAESLKNILDEVEKGLKGKRPKNRKELAEAVVPTLQRVLKQSRDVRFTGDNYSDEWVEEAKKRKLPNLVKSIDSMSSLVTNETEKAFEGILNPHELSSRYEILSEQAALLINIEVNLMLELFRTMIYPAAVKQQNIFAESLNALRVSVGQSKAGAHQLKHLKEYSELLEKALVQADKLEMAQQKALKLDTIKQAEAFCHKVTKEMEAFREVVDMIETLTDDQLWPLPKYRELLFSV